MREKSERGRRRGGSVKERERRKEKESGGYEIGRSIEKPIVMMVMIIIGSTTGSDAGETMMVTRIEIVNGAIADLFGTCV